jgi:O-antigen/teichoic acid export membrane protein
MLVDHYGLKGFAFAQIASNIAIAIISLTILRTVIGIKLWKTLVLEIGAIREMMVFGIGVQLTSLAWALFEMGIRLLMARYGGVQQVGYYEIAYKLSSQARILMGYVGQPVSPVFVRLSVGAKEDLITFYRRIYARYASFAIISILSVAIASPLVSYLMLGRIEKFFIIYCFTTILGTAAHICAIPSELTAIAFGRIRYNLAGTATGAVTCFMLGSLLGVQFQALGVASGVLIASTVAAVIPIIFNSRSLRLPMAPRPLSDLHLKEML